MKIIRKPDGWWIVDTPEGVDDMGPYETKAEADVDRRGVQRFLANPADIAPFGVRANPLRCQPETMGRPESG